MADKFREEIKHLNKQGYQWVGDIFPIAYGHAAPAGFAGKRDEKQRRFNRMVHLSMQPGDASIEEFASGLVVPIPGDSLWCNWLAFGEFQGEYMAESSDGEILRTLAAFHKILDAYEVDRQEFHARMMLRNEQVFEEWLADYAEREGMFVESARRQVLEERKATTRSANGVGGSAIAKRPTALPRHPFSWYEARYAQFSDGIDVIDRNWKQSYEHKRKMIEEAKAEREKTRKTVTGLTISDMNAAGVTYSQLDAKESYRIDDETKEIVIVRTRDGKFLRGTGKFVARLLGEQSEVLKTAKSAPIHANRGTAKQIPSPSVEKAAPKPEMVANEPKKQAKTEKKAAPKPKRAPGRPRKAIDTAKEAVDPLKGVVNPLPEDRSGWKGTRKRRSCVTTKDAYDSASGCLAIGAMFARR